MVQMFLTFLMLPTVLLQANMIVAIVLERLDMWFNVTNLIAYVVLCIVRSVDSHETFI